MSHAEEAIALHRQVGRARPLNRARLWLSQTLVAEGDVERAEPLAADALATATAERDTWAQDGPTASLPTVR